MVSAIDKGAGSAEVLVEALPFIQRLQGQIIVIKLGGAAIDQTDPTPILQDVVLMRLVGMQPVLVHGGGPAITEWQKRLGIETQFVDGLRVTDEETMDVARMVLTGKVGPDLVAAIHRLGAGAIGLSGEDGQVVRTRPHSSGNGKSLGFVGDVETVNPRPILSILAQGAIPVIASIGTGADGHAYNINADSFAAELAVALGATKLLLLTDVDGIRDAHGDLMSEVTSRRAGELVASGVIDGGMIPKVGAAVRATEASLAAHIIDARVPHVILLELLTEQGVGTMVTSGGR